VTDVTGWGCEELESRSLTQRTRRIARVDLRSLSWLAALRQKSVPTLFGESKKIAELGSSAEAHEERVSLEGGVGAVVFFDGATKRAESGIFLAAVSEQGADGIERFDIDSNFSTMR